MPAAKMAMMSVIWRGRTSSTITLVNKGKVNDYNTFRGPVLNHDEMVESPVDDGRKGKILEITQGHRVGTDPQTKAAGLLCDNICFFSVRSCTQILPGLGNPSFA